MNGKPSILVCWVTSGVIRAEFVRSLVAMAMTGSKHWEFGGVIDQVSAYIDVNRNLISKVFVDETYANWMLMVDIDMAFPKDVLDKLWQYVERGEKIVCGVYNQWMGNGVIQLSLTHEKEIDKYRFTPIKEAQYIDAGPAGFLLVHREVLEKVREKFGDHWFSMEVKHTGEPFGEDVSFFRRAKEVGYKILGVPDLGLLHYKVVPI